MTVTATPYLLTVAEDVRSVVRPCSAQLGPVRVRIGDTRMDAALAEAAGQMRSRSDRHDITTAVRTMYKRVGLDPTRNRPSSEALLRRVRKGDALPRVNSVVDVINWCSLESQLPFGLYDTSAIVGDVTLRLGREGESYPGIRKDDVHVGGRLVLADQSGAFGNPTSDSRRTMVTEACESVLVVVFAPADVPEHVGEAALAQTVSRVTQWCSD